MDASLAHDIGLFVARASLAYVYLHGAWMIAGTPARRAMTAARTLALYRGTPFAANLAVGRATGYLAAALMIAGGAGVLLGVATRPAAILLIVFTLPGILVHLRELAESGELVDELAGHAPDAPAPLVAKLRWSAYAGHRSSANKNWALIGVAVFLALAADPNGRLSLAGLL